MVDGVSFGYQAAGDIKHGLDIASAGLGRHGEKQPGRTIALRLDHRAYILGPCQRLVALTPHLGDLADQKD